MVKGAELKTEVADGSELAYVEPGEHVEGAAVNVVIGSSKEVIRMLYGRVGGPCHCARGRDLTKEAQKSVFD